MTSPEDPQVKPSPSPRPKSTTAGTTTQKSPSERITGQLDKPTRKRGRPAVVTFLDRVWDRNATSPQIGWELSTECLATPGRLEQLRAAHATQPDPQVELDKYLINEQVSGD